MKVLVQTKTNLVKAIAEDFEVGNFNGQQNLVKVSTNTGVYYEGSMRSDVALGDYLIEEVANPPQDFVGGKYFYENGEFLLNPDYEEPIEEVI